MKYIQKRTGHFVFTFCVCIGKLNKIYFNDIMIYSSFYKNIHDLENYLWRLQVTFNIDSIFNLISPKGVYTSICTEQHFK